MYKKIFPAFTALLLFCEHLLAQAPRSYSSSELLLQLKKLNTFGSVLYVAAHPDDENTRLIAYLANEKCVRTGYLSLTRGDGGQNLIGPEQGVELGIIRTQELLAARRVDGGEQFFTRAYDFGYSKTPEETFRKWNHDSVLSDVVWVIRSFRPDIIITRFATDGSGGHGHHTASALLAEEAFDAAADPKRFPEQLKYVPTWQARRLFNNSTARFRDSNADMSAFIKLEVGGYNPLLGKSYGEIAAESRSMHRSQGFGSARQRGEVFEYFKPIKGDTGGLKDIFQGMDLSWGRVETVASICLKIQEIINSFQPTNPAASVKALLELRKELQKQSASYHQPLLEQIIQHCSGLFIDVYSPEAYTDNKNAAKAYITYVNRSGSPLMIAPLSKAQANKSNPGLRFNESWKDSLSGYNNYISQPYWLLEKPDANLFHVNDRKQLMLQGAYLHPAAFPVLLENSEINYNGQVQYKWVEPDKGELYRPVTVCPPVMLSLQSPVLAYADNKPKDLKITVKAGRDSIREAKLQLQLPAGWVAEPAYSLFSLHKKGEEKTFSFRVWPGAQAADGMLKAEITIGVEAEAYTLGVKEIRYDHIPVQTLFTEASAKLIRLNLKKSMKRIAYIPGAGDEVTACLSQLGYEVVTLSDDMLATENLSQYEAIISGVRAYNTNEKLPLFKQKLMDYVKNGGNLIVQYNTNSWAGPLSSDIGPYRFKISRERVTDEEVKVNLELPDHPVLHYPNKITAADFEGWVQERCIYSATDCDSQYVMPLSMADPGEKANKGSLIIARHGKGHFVYTGLVFFRQLPAGAPGAYRLFVNLLELGKSKNR